MNRHLKLLLPLTTLLLAALACGSTAPITLNEIALFPGAQEVVEGNIVTESLEEAIKESAGMDAVDVDVRTYTLPNQTSWEMVRDFYRTETGSDWSLADELIQETDFVSTYGWTRGSLTSEQALIVAYTLDPLGGPPFMILALFSE